MRRDEGSRECEMTRQIACDELRRTYLGAAS